MAKYRGPIGPYCGRNVLQMLDGRRREAKQIQATVAELTEHVGGTPSPVQRRLIERVAWLEFHMDAMDAKALERGVISERDGREYLAWLNAYRRTLVALGLGGKRAEVPELRTYLANRAAAK